MIEKNKQFIAVLGDLHLKEILGYSDYISDRRLGEKKEIFDFIIKEFKDCDTVVMLGDQFNARNNPSQTIKEFVNFLERLGDKEIYMLSGNHEGFASGKSALDFLKEVNKPNWHVVSDEVLREEIDGKTLVFSPYFFKTQLDVEDDTLGSKKLMKNIGTGDILFVHHTISDTLTAGDVSTNLFNEIILPKKELEKNFKLIVGGHIHKPQADNKTIIAGSIFNNEVGETQKFIWKIDKKTLGVKQIKLPGRPIIKLENPSVEDIKKLEKNSIVKVILSDKKMSSKKTEIKKALKESVEAFLLLEQYPNERKKLHFEEGMLEFSIEKLLGVYAKTKKVDEKKLLKAWDIIK